MKGRMRYFFRENWQLWAIPLGVCAIWGVLRASALWWRWKQMTRGAGESWCWLCGYAVSPGKSAVCPECGRDVRKSGVVTRDTRPMLPMGAVWGMILIVISPFVMVVGERASKWVPMSWRYSAHRDFLIFPGTATRGPVRLVVQVGGAPQYFRRTPDTVLVYFNQRGWSLTESENEWEPPSMMIRTRDMSVIIGPQSEFRAFSRDVVKEFLHEVRTGKPTEWDWPSAESLESEILVAATGKSPRGEQQAEGGGWNVSHRQVGEWVIGTIIALVVVVAAGVVTLALKVRRWRLERARQRWNQVAEHLGLGVPALTQPSPGVPAEGNASWKAD